MFRTTMEQREREAYFCEAVFVVPLPSVLSNINLEDHALPSLTFTVDSIYPPTRAEVRTLSIIASYRCRYLSYVLVSIFLIFGDHLEETENKRSMR